MKKRIFKTALPIAAVMAVLSLVAFIWVKVLWVVWSCWNNGNYRKEKADILNRRDWLIKKVVIDPNQLLTAMPQEIGSQFQGEWALYSCSMLAKALANCAVLYPDSRQESITTIDNLIQIVQTPELREYDAYRWGEDPLESLNGNNSHISYISHLAWMIGNYRKIGGDDK